MQTLSLQRLTYSRRKQSHDVNAPISFLIKKSGSALINGTITLLPKPLCLYLCASEPKILTADCFSPHAPGQILDGVTRYKSLTCSSSATKPSLCVWENVSLSEHDLIVFPDCEAERGRVCVFIVVFLT